MQHFFFPLSAKFGTFIDHKLWIIRMILKLKLYFVIITSWFTWQDSALNHLPSLENLAWNKQWLGTICTYNLLWVKDNGINIITPGEIVSGWGEDLLVKYIILKFCYHSNYFIEFSIYFSFQLIWHTKKDFKTITWKRIILNFTSFLRFM